ncbi:MAG: hypothetical protein KY459_06245 [Acidobacteria bacterium]|nr:hypothetical protein [Acidobacteriota bacterium]
MLEEDRSSGTPNTRIRILITGTLVTLLLGFIIVVSTRYFFFYRDNFSTHYPVKAMTRQILLSGELPMWNPAVSGGQPLAGNPNYLTFHPTTLLQLIVPARVGFNLHFLIHLALAFEGARRLGRRLGLSPPISVMTGLFYLTSGVVASCASLYNLIVAAAFLPWCVLALETLADSRSIREALRAGPVLGLALGLFGFCGEPLVIAATGVTLILLGVSRIGWRHAPALALAFTIALLIVLPQLIATDEIIDETERGVFSFSPEVALTASLHPIRIPELLAAAPYGPMPSLSAAELDRLPVGFPTDELLFHSIFIGALLLPALLAGSPTPARAWIWKLLFATSLLFSLGRFLPGLESFFATAGLDLAVRYPQKLLLVTTLSGVVLTGMLLESVRSGRRVIFGPLIGVIALSAISAGWFTTDIVSGSRVIAATLAGFGSLAILLVVRNGRRAALASGALSLGGLLLLFPATLGIDRSSFYEQPSPLTSSLTGKSIAYDTRVTRGSDATLPPRILYRTYESRAVPFSAIADGASYALVRSPDGMSSYLSRVTAERFESGSDALKIIWARAANADLMVTPTPLEDRRAVALRAAGAPLPAVLSSIDHPDPYRSPPEVIQVGNVNDAVEAIEGGLDPARIVLVPRGPFTVAADARIALVGAGSQGVLLDLSAEKAGLIVTPHTFFSAWRATTAEGRDLRITPVYVDQLGVEVPAGRSRIELEFSRRRSLILLSWGGSTLLISIIVLSLVGRTWLAGRRKLERRET